MVDFTDLRLILSQTITTQLNMGDSVTTYDVLPATSLKNLYADTTLPHNPGLASNNYNCGHQDSYCSESVHLSGPTSARLRMIKKENPYGFTALMTCNCKNEMIGMAAKTSTESAQGELHLIVFDSRCNIISATNLPINLKEGEVETLVEATSFLTTTIMLLQYMATHLLAFLLPTCKKT